LPQYCEGDVGQFRLAKDINKCIDIEGGNLYNGAPVQIWTCNGYAQQNFKWCADGRIVSTINEKMCLDVAGGDPSKAGNLQMWECNSQPGQYWWYDEKTQAIFPEHSGEDMCLDVDGGSSREGARVNIFSCRFPFTGELWLLGNGPPPSPTPSPKPGQEECIGKPGRFLPNDDKSKCIDIPLGFLHNGAALQIWHCNGLPQQEFKWCSDGRIVSMKDETMCLDVPGGDPRKSSDLQMWQCNGQDGQYWSYDADTMFVSPAITNESMCMDIRGGSFREGNRVNVYRCKHPFTGIAWYTPSDVANVTSQIEIII